jgi:MFS transporter, PPP family, 3-phenylpropionic acid transporter
LIPNEIESVLGVLGVLVVRHSAFPLALFWFLSFSGLGIFFPYFALYLHENAGLDGTQVGIVVAVLPLVGIVAQPLWGYAADRTGARRTLLLVTTIGAALGFATLTTARGFAAIVAATALLAAFLTTIVPLVLSVTFAALRGHGPHAFGLVRVWGTIGYLLSVSAFPWFLHRAAPATAGGAEPGLASMFLAAAACTAAAALVGPWLPRGGALSVRARPGQWRALLRQRALVRLLLFTLVGYVFLQGPMQIFPIFVRAHGGDLAAIGRMWVVMLLLEIPLIALSGTALRRLGARGLLAVGVLAGGLRWTTCALTDHLGIIYAAQLLHGVVVAGLLLGGPLYLERVAPEPLRSTAQGLLAMVGVGIGGIISNMASGWLLEHGGTDVPFLIGGIGGLLLGAAAGLILPVPETASSTVDHGIA